MQFTGDKKRGARLKFRVNKTDNFLRYINYKKDKINILTELKDTIFEKHQLYFNISGITTRLAAFYVDKVYSDECEVRYYKQEKNKEKIFRDEYTFTEMLFDSKKYPKKDTLLTLIDITYEKDKTIFNDNY